MSRRKSAIRFPIGLFPSPLLLLSLALGFLGCLEKDPASPGPGEQPRLGSLSVRIRVDAASPFKAIARSGDVTVTAKDMDPVTAGLVLGDSTVEGTVANVPTGPGRKIEVKVYDSAGTVRYQGSATADMLTDAGVAVSVVLVRKTGTVTVDGTVSETDSTRPPVSTPWGSAARVTLGAQGSAVLGSVLDLDEARAWFSAQAHADQSGIDLVFMYYQGGFHLDNALQARAVGIANDIDMTGSYDIAKIKDIGIARIPAKPADQESARKVFAAAAKTKGAVISAGDRFLAESTGGKLAMVTVVSITGADSRASAEVDIHPVTIP